MDRSELSAPLRSGRYNSKPQPAKHLGRFEPEVAADPERVFG
jgi:hypothetical protein